MAPNLFVAKYKSLISLFFAKRNISLNKDNKSFSDVLAVTTNERNKPLAPNAPSRLLPSVAHLHPP